MFILVHLYLYISSISIYLAKYISMQGVELRQDVENGILFTNYSLVLQKITRNQ